MGSTRLSNQMDAYLQWRQDIQRELMRYRGWLIDNNVNSPELEKKLDEARNTLTEDRITIAFVGEFSRGKTELINALFFSHYGTRVLPSSAGRTTMCPTELFFDQRSRETYIRLLPIETRLAGSNLSNFLKIPEKWVVVPLAQNDPENVKQAFSEVAKLKSVTVEEANAMGFQTEFLEIDPSHPENVMIPAWRHAVISFDHPLLRQGLNIIDTPGLNALGCEPELTFNLLPDAQAILFLLSASTGVTSTDLEIWNQHIRNLVQNDATGVYAIINKIDTVWDELGDNESNLRTLGKLRTQCSLKLGITPDEILSVSAKQGLMAQIEGDIKKLDESYLPELEDLLSNDMMRRKENFIQKSVIKDIHGMLHGSRKILMRRKETQQEELHVLQSEESERKGELENMLAKARKEQGFYHKKQILLKSSRKMIGREGILMLDTMSESQLDRYLKKAGKSLASSWTVVGMNNAIDHFFNSVKHDMHVLADKQALIQSSIAEIYARYEAEQSLAPMSYPRFDAKHYFQRLDDLHNKSGSFSRNLRQLLMDHKATSKRFLSTVSREGSTIYKLYKQASQAWLDEALLPLFQNVQEQKKLLDGHIIKLRSLKKMDDNSEERIQCLSNSLEELDEQIIEVDQMITSIRKPAPIYQARKAYPIITNQLLPLQNNK